MKRKRKTSKKEPQTKAKAMNRQHKEQKPLPLILPLTIVLPDRTHKVIIEENFQNYLSRLKTLINRVFNKERGPSSDRL